jgi:hypothetical protein
MQLISNAALLARRTRALLGALALASVSVMSPDGAEAAVQVSATGGELRLVDDPGGASHTMVRAILWPDPTPADPSASSIRYFVEPYGVARGAYVAGAGCQDFNGTALCDGRGLSILSASLGDGDDTLNVTRVGLAPHVDLGEGNDGFQWSDTASDPSAPIPGPVDAVIDGGPGNDNTGSSIQFRSLQATGGAGDDMLYGAVGDGGGSLDGGEGNDTLVTGPGITTLSGGAGVDTLTLTDDGDRDTVSCGEGLDRVNGDWLKGKPLADGLAADCPALLLAQRPAAMALTVKSGVAAMPVTITLSAPAKGTFKLDRLQAFGYSAAVLSDDIDLQLPGGTSTVLLPIPPARAAEMKRGRVRLAFGMTAMTTAAGEPTDLSLQVIGAVQIAADVTVPESIATAGPRLGVRALVESVSGSVYLRAPGGKRHKLDGGATVRMGSEIDAREGEVRLTAAGAGKARMTGRFADGVFVMSQVRGSRPTTVLRLSQRLGCGSGGVKSRQLRGDAKRGGFAIAGREASARTRGGRWLVRDTCTSSSARVFSGSVEVKDKTRGKTVVVQRGHRYATAR